MDTIIEIIGKGKDDFIYEEASAILKAGGLVAFPTETVYGLGADALNEEAAKQIYVAKGRPSDNPLIVHIADFDAVPKLAREISDKAKMLMDAFWPGPMTLVMKKTDTVPLGVTGGLDTVAIRMPSHPVAHKLLAESGVYIAAPSANTSGRPSPTLAAHVIDDMNGKINMIIQDDTVDVGIESTIIDVTSDDIMVLRPGKITLEMIAEVVGAVRLDPAIAGEKIIVGQPKAPGMKYKHYAPKAELTIVEGDENSVVNYINSQCAESVSKGGKIGIIATDSTKSRYEFGEVRSLGDRQDEASIARHLYAVLREFDDMDVDYIYSESFERNNVGQAIMNRLIKAAGHKLITV